MNDELLEAKLVARLRARDERAFNELVRTYEGRVYGLLVRMIGRREEAEDLAQEVFVQVFKAIDQFRGESKLSTWIFRIASNLCKNRSKYLKRRHDGEQDELDALEEGQTASTRPRTVGDIPRPDEMVSGMQLEHIVERAIRSLLPEFREVLLLRDVEELSYGEIGAITGLAEGTVKSRIFRARQQLKEAVERETGEKI